VAEDGYPVEWVGRQAVVRLPDHIDLSNAGSISEELLALINRGAVVLIVDMAATASCDYVGAEALVRACKRAVASGAQLRLVVPAEVVRRVLSLSGLDRLVWVYPSREAAIAAGVPAAQAAAGAGLPQVSQDTLDTIVGDLFHAGLSLPWIRPMRRADSTSWKPCNTLTTQSGWPVIRSSSPPTREDPDRQTALGDARVPAGERAAETKAPRSQ
jgi:anti-sigma B factor antagonist